MKHRPNSPAPYIAIGLFAVGGVLLLIRSQAASNTVLLFEAEQGTAAHAIKQTDVTTGGGGFVTFTGHVAQTPSDILDLQSWKVTLPQDTDHAGNPDEITQPELDGFTSDAYFTLNPTKDGVIFRAPVGGATTSGSGYPRSELREMTADGSSEASWNSAVGTHTMTIRQAITSTPTVKPHVVAGQIHDANDDVIMIRLEGARLFVEHGGDEAGLLTSNYVLGTEMLITITASAAGVAIQFQSGASSAAISLGNLSGAGWYFKAGCYTQSNTSTGDAPTDFGEVILYDLAISHT